MPSPRALCPLSPAMWGCPQPHLQHVWGTTHTFSFVPSSVADPPTAHPTPLSACPIPQRCLLLLCGIQVPRYVAFPSFMTLSSPPMAVCTSLLLWAKLCFPNLHVKDLIPVPQNMAVLGERVFNEVIKLK